MDERHEGVGLPHGRVPGAQAWERGQQRWMGDEHVFGVEEGRGLPVDLAAGLKDGWVDVDGGAAAAGGHFVGGGGRFGARGDGEEEGVDLEAELEGEGHEAHGGLWLW